MHENYHGCRTRNRSLSRMSVQVDCVRYYFFFFILFSHGSSFRLSFFPLYFFPFPLYQFFTFSSFFSFFYFFCLSFPFLHRPTAPLLYPFTHTHTHTRQAHRRHAADRFVGVSENRRTGGEALCICILSTDITTHATERVG